MKEKLIAYFKDKKVLILGMGMEGYATYSFIRKNLENQIIYVEDQALDFLEKYPEIKEDKNCVIVRKDNYLKDLDTYDVIMKSPGISFKDLDIQAFKEKIKSELEVFLEVSEAYTIGVTGTKGKSTTSSLIYKILSECLGNTFLLGNIGKPLFLELDNINKDSILVLELSSHQLEFVKKSVNLAILLNIYEEHLDHYRSFDDYIEAKINIARYQKPGDCLIVNSDDLIISKKLKELDYPGEIIEFTAKGGKIREKDAIVYLEDKIIKDDKGKILYTDTMERKILGEHNLKNIMVGVIVANIFKLDLAKVKRIIDQFEPLEHRLEYVGEYQGVKYYNDSIATIPEATIYALKTLKDVNTIILGGMDRGVDLTSLVNYLKENFLGNVIALPTTGHKIVQHLEVSNIKTYLVDDMKEAVKIAKEVTQKGSICLLSPAASSYGFFKNFQERGNLYKDLVRNNY